MARRFGTITPEFELKGLRPFIGERKQLLI